MNIEILKYKKNGLITFNLCGVTYHAEEDEHGMLGLPLTSPLRKDYPDVHKVMGALRKKLADFVEGEHTGNSVSYYDVTITHWTNPEHQQDNPVTVSCNDIIEALNMNYAQANVFKAQWRIAAAKQGKLKKGNNTVYDAEKSCFFSNRVLVQEQK